MWGKEGGEGTLIILANNEGSRGTFQRLIHPGRVLTGYINETRWNVSRNVLVKNGGHINFRPAMPLSILRKLGVRVNQGLIYYARGVITKMERGGEENREFRRAII